MLEKRCMSVLGKALASELTPATTLDNAKALVLQTEDAYTLISRFGSPSFDGVKNVAHSLARANAGGMLTMRELLDISSVLKCVHNVLDWRSHCENKSCGILQIFSFIAVTVTDYIPVFVSNNNTAAFSYMTVSCNSNNKLVNITLEPL